LTVAIATEALRDWLESTRNVVASRLNSASIPRTISRINPERWVLFA
jgi:hypothetical protein